MLMPKRMNPLDSQQPARLKMSRATEWSCITSMIKYLQTARPDDWRDFVFYREGSRMPVAVMLPNVDRIYFAPTSSLYVSVSGRA